MSKIAAVVHISYPSVTCNFWPMPLLTSLLPTHTDIPYAHTNTHTHSYVDIFLAAGKK